MKRSTILVLAGLLAATAGAAYFAAGDPGELVRRAAEKREAAKEARSKSTPAPAVSVVTVTTADFAETVVVTGTIVAREEILVSPEVEGLRVLDLAVEEGQTVRKGDVLARIERETLEAQLAQSAAQVARADAALAQARSTIVQAEARVAEARSAFDRAKPLKQSGYLSESVFDQREAASRTADAQLVAARDGLRLAEADKGQAEAQRRELAFRLTRTEIRAPADGLVSRRNARIGAMATAAGEPMFRIVADGEFELDADVAETRLGKLKAGQPARVDVTGVGDVQGRIRLVSPEVDRTSRLGRVRVFLGRNPALKLGLFGRGTVDTAQSRGLAVPASALMFSEQGTTLQAVAGNVVETRRVETGLVAGGLVEIKSGVKEGDVVVARAGSFLRNGDVVRPVLPDRRVSDAAP